MMGGASTSPTRAARFRERSQGGEVGDHRFVAGGDTGPRPSSPPLRPTPRRLNARLLGDVEVALDGQPVPELCTPRVQRLLARLALAPPSGLRRDRLAWETWPDSTDGQARTNLRKLLHDVRRAFAEADELLAFDGQTIRWRPDAPVWIDVVEFIEALDRGDRAGALRHYRGDLLPSCYDEWVLGERERLRALAIAASSHLAASAWAERRHDEAVDHARFVLRLDPVNEPTYRLLMEALAGRGDRTEARRAYHQCVETLDSELGVGVDPATVELYEQLRPPAAGMSAAVAGEGCPPLIGRDAHWQTAWATWRAAMRGSARLLLVTGEAGVGKTRLVEELAAQVEADGHAVSRSRAYQAAGGVPLGPLADWLRSEPVRQGLESLYGVWLDELARLLPELGARRRGWTDETSASDAARRHRLLDAGRRGLLARGQPLLLVIDDLQWCDPDTLEFCAFLIRAPQARVLVAATARDEEIASSGPVVSLWQRLAGDAKAIRIALERLDPQATATIAALAGQRPLDDETAARLFNETEGNPLFVLEAIRAGFLSDGPGRQRVLTPTVQAVIGARLDRLSPDARHLVDVAATIGRAFSPTVVAAAAGASEDDLGDAFDELWQRHIVRERGAAYDFSHDRLREVALETISPARRRSLHRRRAAALEHHHAGDLAPVSARLGFHYESAGLDALAVQAYERAAEHAYRVFALDDGIALVHQALALLDRSPLGPARDEVELRLRAAQGIPLTARRGYGATAVRYGYERALTLHRRPGRSPSPSVLRGLALYAVGTCDFDRAAEMGHALLAAGATDRTALVEGDYVLGVTAFWRGQFSDAEDHLRTAIERYRPEDAPIHVARYVQDPKGVCLARLALTELFRGKRAQAATTMDRARRFAAELDHPMTTGYVCAFDGILAALAPDAHDLRRSVDALEVLAATMHMAYFQALARLLEGWRDVLDGDAGGIAVITEVTDFWRHDQQLHLTFGLSLLARGHLLAGDVTRGRAAAAEAMRWTERTGQAYLLAELLRVDAELADLGGQGDAARVNCQRALDVALEQGSPWLRARALATRGALGAIFA